MPVHVRTGQDVSHTGMGPESNGVQAPGFSQLVQDVQVGIHVVGIVGVGRVVLQVPLSRGLHVLGRSPLRPALVIHHVYAHHLHQLWCIN